MKYIIYFDGNRMHECNTDEEIIAYMRACIEEDRRVTIDNIIAKLEKIRYYADESITYYEQAELKQDIDELDDSRIYSAYDIDDTDSGEIISADKFFTERGIDL